MAWVEIQLLGVFLCKTFDQIALSIKQNLSDPKTVYWSTRQKRNHTKNLAVFQSTFVQIILGTVQKID